MAIFDALYIRCQWGYFPLPKPSHRLFRLQHFKGTHDRVHDDSTQDHCDSLSQVPDEEKITEQFLSGCSKRYYFKCAGTVALLEHSHGHDRPKIRPPTGQGCEHTKRIPRAPQSAAEHTTAGVSRLVSGFRL